MENTETPSQNNNRVEETNNLVRNELNRYTDLLITNVKELRKEYKNLEFTDKNDKMFAVFYMDKIPDFKKFVQILYDKEFKDYNDETVSLLHTLQKVDEHIENIQTLIELGAPESEYSRSESLSDRRSNHRRKK